MKKQLIVLLVLFFLLSLFWEVAHSQLYDWNVSPLQNNVHFYISRIFLSTIGDFIFLSIILALFSIKNKGLNWINNIKSADYILITILFFAIALFIEIRASLQGRWFYASTMPIVLGIGLSPLVQLAITFFLAVWLSRIKS